MSFFLSSSLGSSMKIGFPVLLSMVSLSPTKALLFNANCIVQNPISISFCSFVSSDFRGNTRPAVVSVRIGILRCVLSKAGFRTVFLAVDLGAGCEDSKMRKDMS